MKQVQTRKWGKLLAKRSRSRFPQLVASFAARWRLPIEWMGGAPRHLTIDASVDSTTLARFLDSDEALGLAQLTINAPLDVYQAALDHPRMAQVHSLVVGPVSQPDLARILRQFRALRWLDVEAATPIDTINHKRLESLTLRVHAGVSVPTQVRLPSLDWLLVLAEGPLRTAGTAVELAGQQKHLKALLLRNYDVRSLLPALDLPCLVLDRCQFEEADVETWYGGGRGGSYSLHPDIISPQPDPPDATPARHDRPMIPWVPRPDPKPLDTDALARWEEQHGVQVPPLLRQHLTLDEGVYRWGDAVPHNDDLLRVYFENGPERPYDSVWEHLDDFLDEQEEERAAWVAQGFKPERMFYLAMSAHISSVLLDYSHSTTEPAVVVLKESDDATAGILAGRFDSYTEFFAAVVECPTHDFLFMVALEDVGALAVQAWLDARRQGYRFAFGLEEYDGFALACANTRSDGLVWLEEVSPSATIATLLLDRVDEWDAEDLLEAPTPDDLLDALVADLGGRWQKIYQSA